MSDVVNGKQPPSADFCLKISKALHYPALELLRMAGFLPPSLAEQRAADPELDEACSLFMCLGKQVQQALMATMRSLMGVQEIGNPGTVGESKAEYRPRTLRERMAHDIAEKLEGMPADDAQRVLDLMERLRGDRRGAMRPDETSVSSE